MTRIFLVDDHVVLREGVRRLLAYQPDLQVVGEAGSGEALLAQLPQTPADVVVLDLCLPGLTGLQAMQHLRGRYPAVRVLVLSSTDNLVQVAALFAAGVRGYALKAVNASELVHGIRTVAAGSLYLCTDLGVAALGQVGNILLEGPVKGAAGAAGVLQRSLSGREREVLQLVAEGLTTEAIANRLLTSKRTVETHRQHLMAKTQAKNTAALVRLAVSQGWLH